MTGHFLTVSEKIYMFNGFYGNMESRKYTIWGKLYSFLERGH